MIGTRRQADHVVDDGRLAEQALDGRERRLVADDAALAFQAFQQRGLLAADIGAGAEPQVDIEPPAGAGDIGAEPAGRTRDFDRAGHLAEGVGIFRADVDVAFGRANSQTGDGHALDQQEGVAFHEHAVGIGAAVAFVGIADDVFGSGGLAQHRLPLDAGGKTGPAPPAQPRLDDFLDDLSPGHADRALQAAKAAMGLVVGEGQRIDDPAAGEGQPFLVLEVGDFLRRPLAKRMRSA